MPKAVQQVVPASHCKAAALHETCGPDRRRRLLRQGSQGLDPGIAPQCEASAETACVALLVDMLVAILTTKLSAMPKGLSPLNWLDDFLYLPEVLYVLFFILLICFGPGEFSVDYWLAGKLRK
jgi:hypothetical protein